MNVGNQDLSDLPKDASASLKSFVSTVREGYYTQRGSFSKWQKAMQMLTRNSPVAALSLCVAVGASMRPLLTYLPGFILHLQGTSTTGKSILLHTILSLRADPSDMTWCFDGVGTIKWYIVAANNNFLCLDDVHMAILPDKGSTKPVPSSVFYNFDSDNAPHVTLITTGYTSLSMLAPDGVKNSVEIHAARHSFWPTPDEQLPWWMDSWLNELKLNYGHAWNRIGDSLSTKSDFWEERSGYYWGEAPKSLSPGRKSFWVQYHLGKLWLSQHADICIDESKLLRMLTNLS